ncbi:glycine--tRNA ligase [Lapidilactobacillus concavus DSM 17758]|jgi:glycyl-tRNA synthetase beta chain|uniref:Glycine--tRNA ligase beta subunit n=1 Tax=Lapidilactobacillus concavus DSM 17758 TaxID=1423735 RepID=A0A0R1VYU0_9LACO|nr:glycine--tRNA ligase subunit beta [Lapidilactobacillus concavus]KRM10711.1 glycine--tRNA ligase [Lapidilactobacillus concavus DSM 17758]GEL12468.1 glycine--tRNA ligase beta subunit [Lapidilactobacillus concavus]
MTATYLFEIGLEEMPAHVVRPSLDQLIEKTTAYLKEQRLDFEEIKPFATPRRLAFLITGLAEKQLDQVEEVKGPAKRIAQDAEGNFTKAALGFARGQGVSADAITFKEFKGEPYVFVEKKTIGQSAATVLQGIEAIAKGLTFPTRMKWGSYHFEYIRPIHWLVSLLDDQVVPMQILDVKAGRTTRGHRFLGHSIELAQATDYEAALANDHVIADLDKRQAKIEEQIKVIASQNQWQVDLDPDLLEEVVNLVEYPTAFTGHFDPKYLSVPEPVLITSMKDNQRYFYARQQDGRLAPNFIGVRNGTDHKLENVISGNEKVLVARLEDAKFFFEEDQKHSLDAYVEKLKTVSFHDKIGTMFEKMQRVTVLGQSLGQLFGLNDSELADLKRASQIYKFDLVTGMVGEFPELQGVMGEIYAKIFGENAQVAQAVREHYLPTSANGELPASRVGATLAIADKIDTILAFFSVGMIPSGSNDPYALRRQSFGVVRILVANHWHLSLRSLQAKVAETLATHRLTFDLNWTDHRDDFLHFFMDRLRQFLSEQEVRHDFIDAITDSATVDPTTVQEIAQTLAAHREDQDFKSTIEALTRVLRLADQADLKLTDLQVDPELFENPSEQQLNDAVQKIRQDFTAQTIEQNYQELHDLRPIIEAYFEENMIMAEDQNVRRNRLTQLLILQKLIRVFGNLNELIVK